MKQFTTKQKSSVSIQKGIQLSESYNRSTNLELDWADSHRLKKIYFSLKFQEGLKEILNSITEQNSSHRVRVLSGSPGLGKSTFALLVANMISKKEPKKIKDLMKQSNKSLSTLYNSFQKAKNQKLLPVFLSGFEGDIEQAFKKQLTKALVTNGLVSEKPLNRQGLKKSLKTQNEKTSTLDFYKSTLNFLKTKNYNGIFVIYDEFGKYLEKGLHQPSNLNLQFLQNFAEFCDRSGEKQCHLMLITHLSVSQYASQLPIHIQQEWAKIEGRFQESAFYDKNADYYKMISTVFKKNIAQSLPALAKKYKSYIKKYLNNFTESAFEGFIDLKSAPSLLLNCFPLHPSTLALLPHLSKKVAQNERTLYTFLTRDENHSLKRFLDDKLIPSLSKFSETSSFPRLLESRQTFPVFEKGHLKNESSLLMPYDLYQYFKTLIGKDIGIGGTYKIQLMAQEAFQKLDKKDNISKQIISLMALCSVLKDSYFAPLTTNFIISCFNQMFSQKEVIKCLKLLRDKKIIFYNKNSKQYLLQEGSPIDIDEEIAKLKNTTLSSKNLVQIVKRYFKTDFIIPKKYNFDNAINRFYRTKMISVEELKNLKSQNLVDFYKEDGLLFYVLPFSHDELIYAQSEIQNIVSPLTAFLIPKQFIECRKDIEELNAIDCLYYNKEILSASPLVKKELDRHKEILLISIKSLLKPLIGYMNLKADVLYPKEGMHSSTLKPISHFKELQRYLGDLFETEYNKYVCFNLEYINRHSVSGSITLARKKFIDTLRQELVQNKASALTNNSRLNKQEQSDLSFQLRYSAPHKKNPIKGLEGSKAFLKTSIKSIKNFYNIEGQGPDYIILDSMVRLSGFKYNPLTKTYQVSHKSDYYLFFKEYKKILSQYPQGISGKTLLDILVSPPYGLRLGVIPVFIALADLCFKQPVSHYLDSAYVKKLDGDHYDLLMKYPKKTVIHYNPINNKQQIFLDKLALLFKAKDSSMRSVIEALLRWRMTIPESTKLSSRLSLSGKKLLIQIDSSKEPDKLLFNKIPDCFNEIIDDDKTYPLDKKNQQIYTNREEFPPEKGGQGGLKDFLSSSNTDPLFTRLKKTKKEIDNIYKNLLIQIKSDLIEFIQFINKHCLGYSTMGRKTHSSLRQGLYNSKSQDNMIENFQKILKPLKDYSFSLNTSRFIGRALSFDSSNHKQYFLETIGDVLTGSSPRHWGSKGYSKFQFALKGVQTEIELASEIANPNFKGQSVLVFIDKGQNTKSFIKLGTLAATNKSLQAPVKKITKLLNTFDDIDKRKIILALLQSIDKNTEHYKSLASKHNIHEPSLNPPTPIHGPLDPGRNVENTNQTGIKTKTIKKRPVQKSKYKPSIITNKKLKAINKKSFSAKGLDFIESNSEELPEITT